MATMTPEAVNASATGASQQGEGAAVQAGEVQAGPIGCPIGFPIGFQASRRHLHPEGPLPFLPSTP